MKCHSSTDKSELISFRNDLKRYRFFNFFLVKNFSLKNFYYENLLLNT